MSSSQSSSDPLDEVARLQASLDDVQRAAQRHRREASLAIGLLGREVRAGWTAPAVVPVPIPPPVVADSAGLRCHLEQSEQTDFTGRLSGWAFLTEPVAGNEPVTTVLLLGDETGWWSLPAMPVSRPDVNQAFQLAETTIAGFEVLFRLPRPRERVRVLRVAMIGRGSCHVSAELPLG